MLGCFVLGFVFGFEIETGALIIGESFANDPLSCIQQPNVVRRKELGQQLAKTLAQDTLERGTNYLLCQYNAKSVSIQQAGVCALTSPPGTTKKFFGDDRHMAKIFFKHLGRHMNIVPNALGKMHSLHCGQHENHGYVAMLGSTIPKSGLGHLVLQIPEDIAEQVNADFYLENSNEKNLKFYESRGLVVQEAVEVKFQDRSTIVYAMRKNCYKK
ncbi:Conserved_hypothetical protein [Hexamita inflata]|uniref:Uncharacterized protein n=1 Tax=Hexamita inflata TaxID=28002 RepID=A0ABP1GIL4_9EUKA